jgi:tight adherence protein C
MIYLIYLLIFMFVFLFTLQIFPQGSERVIRERLASEEEKEKKEKTLLVNLLRVFAPLNRSLKLVQGFRKKTKDSLFAAGSSLSVDEFFTLKELGLILLPVSYIIIVGLPNIQPLWIIGSSLLGFILPDIWLKRKINARHGAIVKALPNVIDLLNLAVGAGMDFMVAVKKMIEWSKPNPLVDELNQVWRETNMGVTRRNALRNLGKRVNVPEIASFVRTLVQADKMGTGIDEALRMQSEEALNMRFQRAERAALKAPIKMLFPLLVFILPVVLVIVGGPILLQFLQGGFGSGFGTH